MNKAGVLVIMILLVLLALAGCGGGEEQGASGEGETAATKEEETTAAASAEATEEPIATIVVEETEYSLDPDEVTLERPGTYVFRAVNVGAVTHALEIEGQGIEEETENLQPGESAELMVTLEPGTYEMYCPVGNHEDLGMVGSVTVLEG